MTDPGRHRLRQTFGEDAELYDRYRPGYPQALFTDLATVAGLRPGARVLEIGCGTGQATLPLARSGARVTAVELSASMTTLARRRLEQFSDVEIAIAAFEDWPLPTTPFDLVVSATAFHWLDPDVRLTKSADALRPGGTLAVISTHHIAGGTEPFFAEVQSCYERFDPATPPGLTLQPAGEIALDTTEFDDNGRFGPVRFHRYERGQTYSRTTYLGLPATYSNHRTLPPDAQAGLFACIGDLIDRHHRGQITKRYMTQLATTPRLA